MQAEKKFSSFRINTNVVDSVNENYDVSWIFPCDNYSGYTLSIINTVSSLEGLNYGLGTYSRT